jgi:hypothetical protein
MLTSISLSHAEGTVQLAALTALHSITRRHNAVEARAIDAGGIAALVQLLQSSDTQILQSTCNVLRNLAHNTHTCQEIITVAMTIPFTALLRCLKFILPHVIII